MSEPVTTNPIIIMLINMTIVFLVLISLWGVIELIHILDPTKKKEIPLPKVDLPPAPKVTSVVPPVKEKVEEPGVGKEIVAAISAALYAYGCGEAQIRAIRPIERTGWKESGRIKGR